MATLQLTDLHVSIDTTEILKGLSLTVRSGETHAIMGPNGSGKSTLAATLAGHPNYTLTKGDMLLDGHSLSERSPDERAREGLFLAFQYPVEIPGVRVQQFLKLAYDARFAEVEDKKFPTVLAFRQHLEKLADQLQVKKELLKRGLNEGFSGGEKKRLEILQMALLEPEFAIMDETDSGLDIDAIKAVAKGAQTIQQRFKTGLIVITHYQRILKYLKPDFVHIVEGGVITRSGGSELAAEIEQKGYKK